MGSNLIISIENLFYALFKEVANSFSGAYSTTINKEFEDLKEDILNAPVPGINQDRVNLKKKKKKVVSDYKKAFDLKKQEY